MYNTTPPKRSDLPSSNQLKRSTFIAALSALAILVAVVLPSEYGLDLTGAGRVLGLTEMGDIKAQLAKEQAADVAVSAEEQDLQKNILAVSSRLIRRVDDIERKLAELMQEQQTVSTTGTERIRQAEAAVERVSQALAQPEPIMKNDQITIQLNPGQGTEVKMAMLEGKAAAFRWTANGSVLNYDTHGEGNGRSISYVKGRGVPQDEGQIVAAFDGNHGWFWRNRTNSPVTLFLQVRGEYESFKRVK